MNYNGRKFKIVSNTDNGETSEETIFYYQQEGNILTSSYKGGKIVIGHLIGIVDESGKIDMRYRQVNSDGQLMTGTCLSKPDLLGNNKIRLDGSW